MIVVTQSLEQALKHHEAGELEQAENLYREIIRIDPVHVDALHLLGVVAHQRSDHRSGAEFIRRAIACQGHSALYHCNLGACYRGMNRIADAIASFREAICLEPGFIGARYNLAMALEAAHSSEEAISEYREVLRLHPDFIPALNNLGSLLSSLDRYEEAIECYRRAIILRPSSAEFHYNLANALSRSGHCEEAAREYRESIRLNPELAETYNNLATALNVLGDYDGALAALGKALSLRPEYVEARMNQATIEEGMLRRALEPDDPEAPVVEIPLPIGPSPRQLCERAAKLQHEGNFDQAARLLKRALEIDPNCADAYFALGYGFLVEENYEEAGTHYEQGLLIDDTNAAAWNNLGSIYTAIEDWDEAIACYESALQLDAAGASTHFNLGNVYKDLGQPSEASACYRRALYINPELTEAHINLGVILQQQGRLDEAAASHTRAIQIRPEDAEAHFHRSLNWLLMGDLEKGWDEYEWRWKYDTQPREFPFPAWQGEDLRGRTILIYAEQGVGDELMCASCLPDLIERGSPCVIECDPRLVPLFARSFPLAAVVGKPLPVEDAKACGIDVHIASGSLPGIFRRNLTAFPRRRAYLAACARRRGEWSRRFAELGHGLKVGISWRGGGKPSTKRRRSTVLEQWNTVLSVPGVQFVNLQYGDCAAELGAAQESLGAKIHHWPDADPLEDLEGFAAQIAELDLVISVDNATVHMAGALGVPVWTLLHFAPNWRWMLKRDDSHWYPSMSLVRQPEFGEWGPVFDAAAAQLRQLSTSCGSKSTPQRQAFLAQTHGDSPGARSIAGGIHLPANGPSAADSQAAEEREKYEHIWRFDEYRRYSPGAAALDKVSLVEALRKHGVRTILDAGCGSGKLMWRLMNEFAGEFEVHGFDITDKCLDRCFAPIKDRVLTVGCLWDPADFTRVYDAVVCCDVMEHIPTERVAAVLKNLRGSTRRLAFFSISVVPDAFGPQLLGEALHLTVKKPNWWFAQLALAGFKIAAHALAGPAHGSESQLYVFVTV